MDKKDIELKAFQPKKGQKYQVIHITDIMLHTTMKRSTSVAKKIKEAVTLGKPGRIYSPMLNTLDTDQKTFAVQMLQSDPEFIKMVNDYESQGYKVLLSFPKDGITIVAGKDTKEFVSSVKGQRLLRRLDKGKQLGKL